MNGLLIANKDQSAREKMAALFDVDDYHVITTDSVANALEGILDKSIQVVLLSGAFDEQYVAKFVPLLKKCNRGLSIILVSDDLPLELLRRIRHEGIFYHALKPADNESWDEILQAVSCAFENYHAQQRRGRKLLRKERLLRGASSVLTSLLVMFLMIPQASAFDLTDTGHSGLLFFLFAGFCSLLIVAQLIPALLVLFGMTKEAVRGYRAEEFVSARKEK